MFFKSLWHACVERKNVGYQQGNWFEGVNVGFQQGPFCTLQCPKICPFFTHSYDWNLKSGTGPRFGLGLRCFKLPRHGVAFLCCNKWRGSMFEVVNIKNETILRKQFCETYFKNEKLSAVVTTSYQCVLRFFHPISLKYCACHEKVMPGHTTCCACHAKSS